jgi:tetratricopeptide (TPR) repeat protein
MQQLVTWLPRIVEVTNPGANIAEQSEQLLSTMANGNLDLGSRVVLAQEWIKFGAEGYSRAMEHLRVVTASGDLAGAFGASPYLSLGSLLYESGDCVGSLEMFEMALALAPTSALLMNNVAFARAQCDSDLDQAEQEAKEASRLEPLNANILDTLGFIKIKQGDYAGAGKALRRSLARKRTVAAMLHLAQVKIALSEWDEAETLLKEAGDAHPTITQQSELSQLVIDLAAKKGTR